MTMQDLTGQTVKLSAHTITVKDENFKTRGMVRNVYRFKDLPMNRAMDFFKSVRRAGLWCSGCADRVIVDDNNKLYFLHNLRVDEPQRVQACEAENITVVPVYFVE